MSIVNGIYSKQLFVTYQINSYLPNYVDQKTAIHEEGNPNYGNDKLERSDSEVHLGVDRNSSANVDADGRAQTGRRTMYALMGAGAYGCSGVPAPLIAHLWKIYALPRMIYGLEVFTLTNKAIQLLEKVQRSILRHIQNLPPILA